MFSLAFSLLISLPLSIPLSLHLSMPLNMPLSLALSCPTAHSDRDDRQALIGGPRSDRYLDRTPPAPQSFTVRG